jgi:hypothetical protein
LELVLDVAEGWSEPTDVTHPTPVAPAIRGPTR